MLQLQTAVKESLRKVPETVITRHSGFLRAWSRTRDTTCRKKTLSIDCRGVVGWERSSHNFFWCGNAFPHLFVL